MLAVTPGAKDEGGEPGIRPTKDPPRVVAGFACSKQLHMAQGKIKTIKPSLRMLSFRTLQLEAKKQADPHYRTPQHAAWSKAVLRRSGGRCEHCGRAGVRLFADHIREIKDGGLLYDLNNGQALCGSCHTVKSIKAKTERFLAKNIPENF